MLREMTRVYVSDSVFQRLYNVKKYLCMFAILAYEIVEETSSVLEENETNPGERQKMVMMLRKDVIRKLRNGKPYYDYLNITFDRINTYFDRDPTKDSQAKYLHSPEGKASYVSASELRNFIKHVVEANTELNQLEHKMSTTEDEVDYTMMKQKYHKEIRKLR
jgi:hypothetical protein